MTLAAKTKGSFGGLFAGLRAGRSKKDTDPAGTSEDTLDLDDELDEADEDSSVESATSTKTGGGLKISRKMKIGAAIFVVLIILGAIGFFVHTSGILKDFKFPILYVEYTTGTINANGVDIRATPGDEMARAGGYNEGDPLFFDARDTKAEWLRVFEPGHSGRHWVYARYVNLDVPIRALPIDADTRWVGWSTMAWIIVGGLILVYIVDRRKELLDVAFSALAILLIFGVKVYPEFVSQAIMCGGSLFLLGYAVFSGKRDWTTLAVFFLLVAVFGSMLNNVGNLVLFGPANGVAPVCALFGILIAILELVEKKCGREVTGIMIVGSILIVIVGYMGWSPIFSLFVIGIGGSALPTVMQQGEKKPRCDGFVRMFNKDAWMSTDILIALTSVMVAISVVL